MNLKKMSSNTSPRSKARNQKTSAINKVSSATVQPISSPPSTSTESGKSGRSSPDPTCAICLGKHENKSFTNKCFHEFCFSCLLEWSKVKPECPLCKQEFNAILHNIRSNDDYDEYKIQIMEPEEPDLSALDLVHNRFRYRTTLTQDRRRILAWQRLVRLRDFHENGILPTAEARPRRVRRTGTSNFRRAIYFQRDLWVRPMSDITGRYRETTPEFFQLNPAMTHRLVPWLNRELNVLLTNHENRVSYVLDLILRMITQSHICSRAFREALQEYTGAQTEHFIHEFFQFARSPFDMHGFDENANYEPRNTISHEEVAVSESSDEDIIPQVPAHTTMSSSRASALDIPSAPSPQPGPSGLGRPVSTTLSDDGQSYSVRLQASSGTTSATRSGTPSDEEDVAVVQVVRPPTPELITLSDTEEEEEEEEEEKEPEKVKEKDEEEEPEMTGASASSSRGKALKRRFKNLVTATTSASRPSPRKDKRLKKMQKKRDRSKSSRTPR